MTAPTVDALNAALAGRYVVERAIGGGSMGNVCLAHDQWHDRRVALKVLRPDFVAAIGAERILAAIHTAAGLQHPGILQVFDQRNPRPAP